MRRATAEIATNETQADQPLYALIELMFFAYRDFVRDADLILAGDRFGRAHHRVLYFAARRPGLTITELLDILQITKQSLNRVLKDLVDRGYVTSVLDAADRRQRRLAATARGEALIEEIAAVQSARFSRAFAKLGSGAGEQAAAFLAAMVDAPSQMGIGDEPRESGGSSTRTVDIDEAKAAFSRLVEEAAGGTSFVIVKAGRPLAKVAPIEHASRRSKFGFMKGQVRVPEDFDRLARDEIEKLFGMKS